MLKKVVFIVLAMFVVAGTAYAGTLWGSYKGYSIIKITSNGKPINVSDVPAISMEGHTLLPISILKQFGAKVNFNAKEQTVDVKIPQYNLSVTELNNRLDCIAHLVAYNELGNPYATVTAFVANGFLVTNYKYLSLASSFKVYLSNAGDNREDIEYGDLDDIVAFRDQEVNLIGFPYDKHKSIPISTKKPQKGDRVYSMWNEGGAPRMREGVILSVDQDGSINHNAEIDYSSGGVILDAEGNLIGVSDSQFFYKEAKTNKAIPVQKLQALMKTGNID